MYRPCIRLHQKKRESNTKKIETFRDRLDHDGCMSSLTSAQNIGNCTSYAHTEHTLSSKSCLSRINAINRKSSVYV